MFFVVKFLFYEVHNNILQNRFKFIDSFIKKNLATVLVSIFNEEFIACDSAI